MDIAELRAFIAVVESGSYFGAAQWLGLSRTTLRRQVASLESRAGVPLLEATRKGVAPTAAGQVLARQGRAMMQEVSALLASIREVGQAPSGTLRVVVPTGLPPHALLPLWAALHAAHPKLRVLARSSDDPLREPLAEVDLAVHFGEEAPRGHWLSHVVMRVPERLLASRDYLARRGTPARIEDLASHDLFSWSAPGEDPEVWSTVTGTSFRVQPVLVSTDIHLLRQACIAGMGIGFLPDATLPDPGVEPGTLVAVLPAIVGRERALRASVPAALAEIPKVKIILDRIRQFVGAL